MLRNPYVKTKYVDIRRPVLGEKHQIQGAVDAFEAFQIQLQIQMQILGTHNSDASDSDATAGKSI